MSSKQDQQKNDLENIIRALANVWPAERDNVMTAGAQFEEVIEKLDKNAGQLQKLIDLAWKGLKHLYEKDEYFISVKTATMQAVNTIREYVINEGDIPVEDFEKAFTDLDTALTGKAESVDELIDPDSVKSPGPEKFEDVIRLLADVWPAERDNVVTAGATFEEIIDGFNHTGQVQKLIDLAWRGLKHLHEKDEYFISVKTATMQAINTIREYKINDGDIPVEDFEKACVDLDKALAGRAESADELLEPAEKETGGPEDLENIIRALADVWPNDRDNVMTAGAKFEEIIDGFDKNVGQLQNLIDLAWKGLKHLYEKDEYFASVKATTMQAVNTIREYVINEGDIPVEDFEKACVDLEKALAGRAESADEVIELNEESSSSSDQKEVSLDDLASFIMTLDEESATKENLQKLTGILEKLHPKFDKPVAAPLKEALKIAEKALSAGKKRPKKWLAEISEKTEAAIELEMDESWEETAPQPDKPDAKPAKEVHSDTQVFTIPEDTETEMLGEFITECTDLIETAESALLDLEESPDDDELINTVFRAFHTIKGTSAFMGLDPISEFTHSVETLLSMVREGDLPFDSACADINLESIDIIKQMLEVIEASGGGDPLPKPNGFDSMLAVLINIYDEGVEPAKALAKVRGSAKKQAPAPAEKAPEPNKAAAEQQPQTKKASPVSAKNGNTEKNSTKPEAESTVRVNVNRLDRLIDMVGELVIAHSVVAQEESISKNTELQKKVNHTSKILRELQDTSLTLRMVPLKATFHKMNRLVRDISRKAGKPIKFSTIGEDTEIDRNMVDIINEPLVHMLRNAIDHGVEDPGQREASGKPATANVYLKAYQEGGKVVIEIEDDGRGIDKDKIFEKAVSKGLIEPDKKLSESEIFNLIFLPGFSSVEKVTDLSGRGVGMDVVKRSIEQLQGKVDVTSQLGKGTKITIELPFTLAITDGMLVRVGDQRFIVPTINIDMTFRAVEEDLFTVMGNAEQVSFRGKSVPVIRLHRIFEIHNSVEDILQGTLLVIKNNNKRYALLVDEVIGQQQLVGKSINMMVKMPHISGGAILGDGRVGLILDTGALVMN